MIDKEGEFCISCGHEVLSFEGLSCCPSCGSKSIPANWKDTVTVEITWHELSILTMWAERWFNHFNAKKPKQEQDKFNPVFTIAHRLRKQHPEKWKVFPLTLASQVSDLVDELGPQNVQHNIPGVEGGGRVGS